MERRGMGGGRFSMSRGLLAGLLATLGMGGCATVNPRPDFQQAAQVVTERTGSEEVYDPATDEMVEARVDKLLAGGLTVDEAVSVALLNNRSFQSLFQRVGASRADLVQSGLLTNPSLSLSIQFPEGGGIPDVQAGFAQELVDLWQIPVRKRIAGAQLDQVILEVANRAVELAAQVKARYYQIVAVRQKEEVNRENIKLAEQSMELAVERFKAGEANRLDVNLIQAKLQDARLNSILLQQDREVAEVELARAMTLSRVAKGLIVRDPLPGPATLPDDGALVAFAMTQRIDVKIAQSQVVAAEEELLREYLNVFPSVSAGFILERMENRALPGRKILADTVRESVANGQLTAPSIQSRAQRALEKRQVIDAMLGPSLQATLPIWDQNQAQIAKAGFKAAEKRKDYEDLLDAVARDVLRAAAVARNTAAKVRYYRETILPLDRQNIETARRLYQAGEQPVLVLIEAQQALIRERLLYQDVLRDYAVALAELEAAVGGRLPPSVTTETQPAMEEPVGPPLAGAQQASD
jgi:cobalt-zinc-cadmium efflux system outer membrane protein